MAMAHLLFTAVAVVDCLDVLDEESDGFDEAAALDACGRGRA
jgi:hypothetical protein